MKLFFLRITGFFILFLIHFYAYSQTPVSSEADLIAISKDLNGSYILTNDIFLTKDWEPIGKESPFRGILNGNNHVIRNLKINDQYESYIGLFSRTENAVIKNLGIENAIVIAGTPTANGNFVGILAGIATNTTISNTYIVDSYVEGRTWIGSFAGRINGNKRSEITNSYSSANIKANKDNAGGIFGSAENTSIVNVYYSGKAETVSSNIGGILGMSLGGDTIANCLVLSPSLTGETAGRIVGKEGGVLTLRNNYARADLLVGKKNAGAPIPVSESYIRGKQGENVPFELPEYMSEFPHYTEVDVGTAFQSFHRRYFSPSKNIYRSKYSKDPVAAIWTQAIFFDVAMNVYKRTGSEEHKVLINRLYKGNYDEYAGFNWEVDRYPNGWFIFDDIMWWVISLARLHEITGDQIYLDLSVSGFDRVWFGANGKRGSYDPEKGGMYWNWVDGDNGKMACINYPTVIAAMTLYNITGKEDYLEKAKEIYAWAKKNLFDVVRGRVADSNHGDGPAWKMHTYNQATCIGAAVMLYQETGERDYLEEAVIAANYLKNQMSKEGLLPFETGIEQGIYNAILAQYIIRLIEDCEQYQYIPWLHYNIDMAWANRDKSTNITDMDHSKPVSDVNTIESYEASGIPALMQVISPSIETEKAIHCKSKTFFEKNLGWDMENTWTLSGYDSIPQLKNSLISDVENISRKKPFIIYQNNGQLFMESLFGNLYLEIYKPTGILIKKKTINELNSRVDLPSGIYIIKVIANGYSHIQKIAI